MSTIRAFTLVLLPDRIDLETLIMYASEIAFARPPFKGEVLLDEEFSELRAWPEELRVLGSPPRLRIRGVVNDDLGVSYEEVAFFCDFCGQHTSFQFHHIIGDALGLKPLLPHLLVGCTDDGCATASGGVRSLTPAVEMEVFSHASCPKSS